MQNQKRKMLSSTSDDPEIMIYSKDDWNNSLESILNQRIGKLTKSESIFKFSNNFTPNLTLSELELREAHLKNLNLRQSKWNLTQDKYRPPRSMRTRSLLRDELEMLQINLSVQDKIMELKGFPECPLELKKKGKRNNRLTKHLNKISCRHRKRTANKIRDLLIEIEGSHSAKTDTVIWKFLKRDSSFKKDFIYARQLLIELQAIHFPASLGKTGELMKKHLFVPFPSIENSMNKSNIEEQLQPLVSDGLINLSNSCFHNTQPIKITCPNCGFFITTRVQQISTVRSKITSVALAIMGLCFFPHIVYAFKDSVHLCPLCKIYLGFCPAFGIRNRRRVLNLSKKIQQSYQSEKFFIDQEKMVSASSTSAKNLFVESKLRLSDRVQVNVNNIAGITRQIQRGSKANENLIAAAKNFALQEAAIENSETNLKKLKLLLTHVNNQLDALHSNTSKMELVLEQVRSMQR